MVSEGIRILGRGEAGGDVADAECEPSQEQLMLAVFPLGHRAVEIPTV